MSQISKARRKEVYEITRGHCFYCGCRLDLNNFHIDHYQARSNGGQGRKNLVPSCPECNLAKGKQDIEEFRKMIEKYYDDYHVKMIKKYMKVTKKPVVFYFEKCKFPNPENVKI